MRVCVKRTLSTAELPSKKFSGCVSSSKWVANCGGNYLENVFVNQGSASLQSNEFVRFFSLSQ